MADLATTLPSFSTTPHSNLLPSLERAHICTADLLSLDTLDVARLAGLPARQVRRLREEVEHTLRAQLEGDAVEINRGGDGWDTNERPAVAGRGKLCCNGVQLKERWKTVSCLDEGLDRALSGGFPTGFITEVTGESGAGKTQLLLTLLLSAQLPPSRGGLGRNAVYISTESPLQTVRLTQLLSSHPVLSKFASDTPDPASAKPSLSRILSIQTPDLESQDHILRYQLPVAVKRHDVGLVAIDSITANFRAEFERGGAAAGRRGPASMARRSALLVETGALLRDLARREDVAVVVANQVADRFGPAASSASASASQPAGGRASQQQQRLPQLRASGAAAGEGVQEGEITLDHQQRFFTGWGDSPKPDAAALKTPSLGLVWTNLIAARVALVKRPTRVRQSTPDALEGRERGKGVQRFMKVAFAPWAADDMGRRGTEFVVEREGLRAVAGMKKGGG